MLLQIAAGLAHVQIILTKSEPIKDFDYVWFTNQTICLCLHWIIQIITQHGRDQTMSSPQRSVTRRSSMIVNEVQGCKSELTDCKVSTDWTLSFTDWLPSQNSPTTQIFSNKDCLSFSTDWKYWVTARSVLTDLKVWPYRGYGVWLGLTWVLKLDR